MSFDPIQHPLQGFAKLAQALASLNIEGRASAGEKGLEKKRADALAEALGPIGTGQSTQLPGTSVQLESIGSSSPDNLGITNQQPTPPSQINIPGRRVQDTRQRTLSEMVKALPTDLGEQITGNVLQRRAMVEAGLTPAQLSAQSRQSPFMLKLNDAINAGLPQVALRGMVAKEIGLEAVNVFKSGDTTPRTAMRVGGRLFAPTEITADKPFGIGKDITDQVAQAGVSIQPSDLSAFGDDQSDARGIMIGYRQSVGIIDSLADDITRAGDQSLGFTAAMSGGINTMVKQFQATARLVGRSFIGREPAAVNGKLTAEVNGEIVPESQLFNTSLYDIDTSALTSNAQVAQRIKTQSLQLAYAMARAADPGGRLSDKDVQIQLDSMGLGQGGATVALTALGTMRELLDRNTSISLDVMSNGRYDFTATPPGASLSGFMGPGATATQNFSGFRDQEEVEGSDGWIYRMQNGVPVKTDARWK